MLNWFIVLFRSTISFYFSAYSINFLEFDIEIPTKNLFFFQLKILIRLIFDIETPSKNLNLSTLRVILIYSGTECNCSLFLTSPVNVLSYFHNLKKKKMQGILNTSSSLALFLQFRDLLLGEEHSPLSPFSRKYQE